MLLTKRKTAGELAQKALSDHTPYIAREVGEAMCEDTDKQLRICIEKNRDFIDEEEFCLVRLIAEDPLIKPLKRIKYYAWPYLPSPRPNQSVFLYNKPLDKITKRLWVLPNAWTMSFLSSTNTIVPSEYLTMQAWSIAFFKGTFWDYVRHDQNITMPSEQEYLIQHREELIKAGCKHVPGRVVEPFDFGKINTPQFVDSLEA